MTTDQRAQLGQQIQAEIEKTRLKITDLEAATQPISPENSIGRVSRMDAINNKSVMEAALRTARRKLSALQHAENRLDDPGFGKCSRCGSDIQPRRLMLMPESPYCIRCAAQR